MDFQDKNFMDKEEGDIFSKISAYIILASDRMWKVIRIFFTESLCPES
jgi:hypothetical protein